MNESGQLEWNLCYAGWIKKEEVKVDEDENEVAVIEEKVIFGGSLIP